MSMKVTFESSGNFEKSMAWLDRVSKVDETRVMKSFAKRATENLKAGTPKATGGTASGWKDVITKQGDVVEVGWVNNAYPGLYVNMALLIELGHGTGTGGYVPPRPYIKQAMNPVWAGIDQHIIRELIK